MSWLKSALKCRAVTSAMLASSKLFSVWPMEKTGTPIALLFGEIGEDGGGVDAAGEEEPEGHVGAAAAADRLAHTVVELLGEVVGRCDGRALAGRSNRRGPSIGGS